MRTRTDVAGAVLVGLAVAAATSVLAGDALLAVASGGAWSVGVALALHVRREYPAFVTGESWQDKRWTALSSAVTVGAALLGVSPFLPVSPGLRFGLGMLVVGAAFVAYTAGTLAVLERGGAPATAAGGTDGGASNATLGSDD